MEPPKLSEIDRKYYQDVKPWNMDGNTVKVVDDNAHIGQIVSGLNQEETNVDLKMEKGKKVSIQFTWVWILLQMHAQSCIKTLHIQDIHMP